MSIRDATSTAQCTFVFEAVEFSIKLCCPSIQNKVCKDYETRQFYKFAVIVHIVDGQGGITQSSSNTQTRRQSNSVTQNGHTIGAQSRYVPSYSNPVDSAHMTRDWL